MKLLLFLSPILFISGCCVFTSRDCGCDPPDPALFPEALSWMEPYKIPTLSIYENEFGKTDTLVIQFESGTEYCGGEECGSNCEYEIAFLTSPSNPEFEFTISAKEQSFILINSYDQMDSLLFVELNTLNQHVYVYNENSTTTLEQDYEWDSQFLTVIKIDCNDPVVCSKYQLTNMIISKEKGLLEYRLNSGEKWHLLN